MRDDMRQGIIKGMSIEVKEGEIALAPGDFYAMRKNGEFVEKRFSAATMISKTGTTAATGHDKR